MAPWIVCGRAKRVTVKAHAGLAAGCWLLEFLGFPNFEIQGRMGFLGWCQALKVMVKESRCVEIGACLVFEALSP